MDVAWEGSPERGKVLLECGGLKAEISRLWPGKDQEARQGTFISFRMDGER
jgi:hypothetical protein